MVDEVDAGRQHDERAHSSYHPQKTNHSQVLEEEGPAQVVPSRKDYGRQQEREEHFVIELDGLVEDLSSATCTSRINTAVSEPRKMATTDSCK